jgi:hypothetical protein
VDLIEDGKSCELDENSGGKGRKKSRTDSHEKLDIYGNLKGCVCIPFPMLRDFQTGTILIAGEGMNLLK